MLYHTTIKLSDTDYSRSITEDPAILHRFVCDLIYEQSKVTLDPLVSTTIHVLTKMHPDIDMSDLHRAIESITTVQEEVAPTQYQFHVVANPIHTVKRKRVGIMDESKLYDWFHKHISGCEISKLNIAKLGASIFNRIKIKDLRQYHEAITLHTVAFSGELTVTDTDQFTECRWHGLGSGKAFGYGTILLKEITTES